MSLESDSMEPSVSRMLKTFMIKLLRTLLFTTFFGVWAVPGVNALQTSAPHPGNESATQTTHSSQSTSENSNQSGTPTGPVEPGTTLDNKGSASRSADDQSTASKQNGERPDRSRRSDRGTEPPVVSPPTPFQTLVERTLGESLPLFGRSLFQTPDTFAALPDSPPPTDYVISTGDQVLVRIWGPITMNEALTVDRAGDIYLPQVGVIRVGGLPYSALSAHIQNEVGLVFKNFNIAVNLGQLHSIQIFVTGQAQVPGTYTVSSLSTLVNAVFASGGPSSVGSIRRIDLRRDDKVVTTFDFYELLVHGNKSGDAHLLPGDVIFIPPVGAEVALGGQVKVPAIYEAKAGEKLSDLLAFAGGPSTTASAAGITLQRLVNHEYRETLTLPLTPAGLATALNDGDVLLFGGISNRFENTVSIRGNLANPGRFTWKPGMHLRDILPAKEALLTQRYWDTRNAEGNSNFSFQAAPERVPVDYSQIGASKQEGTTLPGSAGGIAQDAGSGDTGASVASRVDVQAAPVNRVTIPAPEIDWSYAVIERTDPDMLRNELLPFNLGKLVLEHDQSQNYELRSGDVVTIFSQNDFDVPQEQRTKLVRVEGEVISAGVYTVHPGETLQSVVTRAGGLSSAAYVFGAQFTRESTRALQQQRLNEYVEKLSVEIDRSSATQALSIVGGDNTAAVLEQRMIDKLRAQRATGRIVLDTTVESRGVGSLPDLALEDGDVFTVPSRPAVVNVIGSVNNQGSFLYKPGASLLYYLRAAGRPDRTSDPKHAFIIRANGSVLDRKDGGGSFEKLELAPGDTLVIPAKLFKLSSLRALLESSTSLSQLAVVVAALAVVR